MDINGQGRRDCVLPPYTFIYLFSWPNTPIHIEDITSKQICVYTLH
jgi:hypothetical protein